MNKDICTYVSGCLACQAYKPHCYKTKAPLYSLPVIPTPFENITIDLIGPLPESRGYDTIFTIVNRYLKRVMFVLTNMTISSEGFARTIGSSSLVFHTPLPVTETHTSFLPSLKTFIESLESNVLPLQPIILKQMDNQNIPIKKSKYTFISILIIDRTIGLIGSQLENLLITTMFILPQNTPPISLPLVVIPGKEPLWPTSLPIINLASTLPQPCLLPVKMLQTLSLPLTRL